MQTRVFRQIHLTHPASADLGDDAVMRQGGVGWQFFIHHLSNSFRQTHSFQQILESRVVTESFKLNLPADFP